MFGLRFRTSSTPLEERPTGPEHDRGGESALAPVQCAAEEHADDRLAHRKFEDRCREHSAHDEPARRVTEFADKAGVSEAITV